MESKSDDSKKQKSKDPQKQGKDWLLDEDVYGDTEIEI